MIRLLTQEAKGLSAERCRQARRAGKTPFVLPIRRPPHDASAEQLVVERARAGHLAAAGAGQVGRKRASRRAYHACAAFCALTRGRGAIRTPWCACGYSDEPIYILTDGTRWHKSLSWRCWGRDVKYALMGPKHPGL